MSEELKIIIKAVTQDAQKGIKDVNKQLGGLQGAAGKGGKAMAAMAKAATVAVAAVAAVGAAVVALGTALVAVSAKTAEYRKSMAQLTSAFQSNGASATQAKKTYSELFRFMGETDTAVEAANLLSQLTQDEKELAQWTKTLQGVYATFPDSLPIESLVEASNETARVGKVTGTLADALNWAGVSEDEFNAKLATTNSLAEREALIRETLSGLYDDAAELYEENAAAILAQNEAQNKLNETTARVGAAAQPLQTALTNLGATILNALAPAIEAIVPYLVTFINWISKAVEWVLALVNALTGSNKAVKETEKVASAVKTVGTNASNAANGAGAIADGMQDATKAAEKLKRATAGFDELNIMSNPASSASGSSGSGSSTPAYTGSTGGGVAITGSGDDLGLTGAFDNTSKSAEAFANKIKGVFAKLKDGIKEYASLFKPTFDAWGEAFSEIKQPAAESFESIKGTLGGFWNETLVPFGAYLTEDFVPTITNNFSENFAPIFSDVMSFAVKQFAEDFAWMCEQVDTQVNDIFQPAMEHIKMVTTDTMDAVGNEWEESGGTLLELFGGFIDSIKEIWENLYNKVLKPVWDIILEALNTVWENALKPLWEKLLSFFSKLAECVMTIWNNVLAPIVNWIIDVVAPVVVSAVQAIMRVVKTVFQIISDVLGGIFDALGGLLDFITGIFSGNWKKAWQGIKDFFKGIWDAIWGIVKGIVNLIIDGINLLWSGIYGAVAGIVNGIGGIAGAIGDLFGADWSFSMPSKPPLIPKLAKGGIVTSETLATIGERGKEAVLPLENNTEWMDKLAEKINGNNNTPTKLVLMLDSKELGYATINSINNITKQTGTLQLSLA